MCLDLTSGFNTGIPWMRKLKRMCMLMKALEVETANIAAADARRCHFLNPSPLRNKRNVAVEKSTILIPLFLDFNLPQNSLVKYNNVTYRIEKFRAEARGMVSFSFVLY